MKVLFCILYVLSLVGPDLGELRKNYPLANDDKVVAQKMYAAIQGVSMDDQAILAAYKGGLSTIMAKHSKGIKDKKTFFKEGVALLEQAVEKDPNNIEIRCIRLGVQENSPKFLRYNGQIEGDKAFIIENYSSETSQEIKAFVKGYVQLSDSFSTAERQLF